MAQLAQVVDMELFAVAELTSEFDIHLSAYKIISDNASKKLKLFEKDSPDAVIPIT